MAIKGNLEALILGVLTSGPLHGYAIARAIEERGGGLLKMGENQLYPALHKLEREGQVEAEWQPQENKPPRKVYSLTEAGTGALAKYKKEWEKYASSVSAILGSMPTEAQHG